MFFLFDIDETLVSGDVIKAVSLNMYNSKRLDRIYTGADCTNFDLEGLPEELKFEVRKAFLDPFLAVENKTPIPEAYHFLAALQLNNHRFGLLTARPKHLEELTIKKMKEDFPYINFSEIIFVNNGNTIPHGENRPSKKKYLEQRFPDAYFDDCIEYCNMAAELGIETYLICNKYTGWNHNQSKLLPKVKAVKHVGQFEYRSLREWDIRQEIITRQQQV